MTIAATPSLPTRLRATAARALACAAILLVRALILAALALPPAVALLYLLRRLLAG